MQAREEEAKIRGEVPQPPKSDVFAPMSSPSTPSSTATSIGVSAAPKGSDSNPSTILLNHLSSQKSESEIVSHARISNDTIKHESDLSDAIESDKHELDEKELQVHKPELIDLELTVDKSDLECTTNNDCDVLETNSPVDKLIVDDEHGLSELQHCVPRDSLDTYCLIESAECIKRS